MCTCLKGLLALQVDYLWAPRHFDLVPNLKEYHTRVAGALSREQLLYITFAGFWEDQSLVPGDYLAALDEIRQGAKLLIIMGVPLVSLQAANLTAPQKLTHEAFSAAFSGTYKDNFAEGMCIFKFMLVRGREGSPLQALEPFFL